MQIISLAKAGLSLREISELTGIPKATIHYRLRVSGVALVHSRGGNQRKKLSYDDIRVVEYLYTEKGKTMREIADMLGLKSHSAIQNRLAHAGVLPTRIRTP
mgnify:CR=1 FL=1